MESSANDTNSRQYTWSEALGAPYYRIHMQIGEIVRGFLKRFWPELYTSRKLLEETAARYETLKAYAHFLEGACAQHEEKKSVLEQNHEALKKKFEDYGVKTLRHLQALEERCTELTKLCTEDHLSGLHNRRGLEVRFAAEVGTLARTMRRDDEHRKLPVIMAIAFDLDHFKEVNDRHGHAVGDQVLLVIAELMRKQFAHRPEDIIARIGGDEFLVILPRATWESAYRQAILFTIAVREEPRLTFPAGLAVTASVGIARVTLEAGASSEKVLLALQGKADQALYAAKERGRNMVVRHDHMSPLATVLAALTTTPAPLE